jgi:Flp pilus assembly protein TadD
MLDLLLAAAIAAPSPPPQPLLEAAHAISAGRLDQARTMIANAVSAGATGAPVDRLIADLAFESGRNEEALAGYEALLARNSNDLLLTERAGLAALKAGKTERAAELLERSSKSPATSWRGLSALGTIADLKHDWAAADAAYAEAGRRSPDRAEIYNNMGWSKMLRGDWAEALPLLLQAAQLDPKSERIANNLELARTAVAEDLPKRRPRESSEDWAARLNDAGVIARLRGDQAKAIAAFSRAVEVRDIWYERASNNLKVAQAAQ